MKNHRLLKKGSCFLVVFPLEVPLLQQKEYAELGYCPAPSPQAKNNSVEIIQKILLPQEPENQKKAVLVVEDNILAQEAVRILLADLRCTVDTADCGEQALNLFSEKKYALIFMDVGLPDMSGYSVINKMRERKINSHTPIVLLTAHAAQEVKRDYPALEVEIILSKPLSREQASELVCSYVN